MAKLAYLECPTGIAGDMCLGALVHAGVPLAYLSEQLERLGIAAEYELQAEQVQRNGQQATKVRVLLTAEAEAAAIDGADPHTTFAHHSHSIGTAHSDSEQHHHTEHHHAEHSHSESTHSHSARHAFHARHLPEIEQLITAAQLPPRATAWSLAVFRRLAIAEGAVHGIAPEQVHFHEVGATDAIVDIVGTCLGLDWLGIDQLFCSALPTGGGIVRAAHGQLPVPTPAVLKLWEMRQVPIYSNGIQRELVTPTGAAIVTTLATRFGAPPPLTLHKVGLGAGSRDLPIPNLLRLWIGEGEPESSPAQNSFHLGKPQPATHRASTQPTQESAPATSQPAPDLHPSSFSSRASQEPIVLLATQIDDLNPQAIGYVYEALFAVGAMDVFTQAIGMKKSRLGILLSVVCHPQAVAACESVLFRETTTLGIRRSMQQRTILQREFHTVQTDYGRVQVKVARSPDTGEILNVQPEYEDCAAIARQTNRPWREIHQLSLQQWHDHQSRNNRASKKLPSEAIPFRAQVASE